MIISKTPLRVSFVGGGTDLPDFYRRGEFGCVVSTAINKFVYISIHPHFEDYYLIKYRQIEKARTVNGIKNTRVREALRRVGIEGYITITSDADVPAKTGLGSSSSFMVSLLHVLYAYNETFINPQRMAEEAADIEINVLKEPIGKQDQYIAALGGLRYIQFNPDDTVFTEYIICSHQTRIDLENRLLMFYIGGTRNASDILQGQRSNIDNEQTYRNMVRMRDLALRMKSSLQNNDLSDFGLLLDENWQLKKTLSSSVSNNLIDDIYSRAIRAGALGGKLLGAGATGFLLFYVEEDKQSKVRKALSKFKEYPIKLEPQGSRIIHSGD